MRRSTVFLESFVDGFTMAGFMTRLRHPDEGAPLFAAKPLDKEEAAIVVEHTDRGWEIAGDLRRIPESGLQAMVDLLTREKEGRKTSAKASGDVVHGSS